MKPSTFANLVSSMLYEKRCGLVDRSLECALWVLCVFRERGESGGRRGVYMVERELKYHVLGRCCRRAFDALADAAAGRAVRSRDSDPP